MISIFYYAAVSIILFYLIATIIKFREVPVSISNTYYMWTEAGRQWLFTFVMWIVGFLLLFYWVTVAENYRCQFLSFFSVAGMMFVGGACMFKETLTRATHYISAFCWAGSALLFFLINEMYLPVVAGLCFGVVSMAIRKFRKNESTFWAECACIVMMMVGLFNMQ